MERFQESTARGYSAGDHGVQLVAFVKIAQISLLLYNELKLIFFSFKGDII